MSTEDKGNKGGDMGLEILGGTEPDTFMDAAGIPVLKEATVLHSELKHCAEALEEKLYRMRYHNEAMTLEWLAEISSDVSRMLRTAQEK